MVDRRLRVVPLALFAVACAACGPEGMGESPEPLDEQAWALGTVGDSVANSCSTLSVEALAQQIVAQENCLIPGALVAVPKEPNLAKPSTVYGYMQPPARDALVAALKAHPGMTLGVNSMLRTVAQQYLLYAWYKAGKCGIQLAATPGTSNHEWGLALDTSDYNAWNSALSAKGFKWFGSSDVVHFDYVGAGIKNLHGKDVLAFQMLWNLNHPTDPIDEDGLYGPQTEARLKASPAAGFAKPPSCATPPANDAGTGGAGGAGGADAASDAAVVDGAEPDAEQGSEASAWPDGAGGAGGTDSDGGAAGDVEGDAALDEDGAQADAGFDDGGAGAGLAGDDATEAGCACRVGAPRPARGGLAFGSLVALGLVAVRRRRHE